MSCARGCCATQAEHYKSLRVGDPDRKHLQKVTTHRDSDAGGGLSVDVTEHWHDRQDVLVKPKTLNVKMAMQEKD